MSKGPAVVGVPKMRKLGVTPGVYSPKASNCRPLGRSSNQTAPPPDPPRSVDANVKVCSNGTPTLIGSRAGAGQVTVQASPVRGARLSPNVIGSASAAARAAVRAAP